MSVTSRTIRAPAVSVVVPARDAERTIGACLRALARQALAPVDYEVIVVDDGSADDTAAIAGRFRGVRVLRQRRLGTAAARRAGAAAARGEVVAFADPAEPPADDWLEALVRPFADPAVTRAPAPRRSILRRRARPVAAARRAALLAEPDDVPAGGRLTALLAAGKAVRRRRGRAGLRPRDHG